MDKKEMTRKEMIISFLDLQYEKRQKIDTESMAETIGSVAHLNQYRDNGKPYFIHPKHCRDLFYDLVSKKGYIKEDVLDEYDIPKGIPELAFLHDVVEDTELSLQDVKDIFAKYGHADFFEKYLEVPLNLITHDEQDDYDAYIDKVMEHPASALVKMLDLTDNMNLFGLFKVKKKDLERVSKYAKYFKKINDKYHYLERLNHCYPLINNTWVV